MEYQISAESTSEQSGNPSQPPRDPIDPYNKMVLRNFSRDVDFCRLWKYSVELVGLPPMCLLPHDAHVNIDANKSRLRLKGKDTVIQSPVWSTFFCTNLQLLLYCQDFKEEPKLLQYAIKLAICYRFETARIPAPPPKRDDEDQDEDITHEELGPRLEELEYPMFLNGIKGVVEGMRSGKEEGIVVRDLKAIVQAIDNEQDDPSRLLKKQRNRRMEELDWEEFLEEVMEWERDSLKGSGRQLPKWSKLKDRRIIDDRVVFTLRAPSPPPVPSPLQGPRPRGRPKGSGSRVLKAAGIPLGVPPYSEFLDKHTSGRGLEDADEEEDIVVPSARPRRRLVNRAEMFGDDEDDENDEDLPKPRRRLKGRVEPYEGSSSSISGVDLESPRSKGRSLRRDRTPSSDLFDDDLETPRSKERGRPKGSHNRIEKARGKSAAPLRKPQVGRKSAPTRQVIFISSDSDSFDEPSENPSDDLGNVMDDLNDSIRSERTTRSPSEQGSPGSNRAAKRARKASSGDIRDPALQETLTKLAGENFEPYLPHPAAITGFEGLPQIPHIRLGLNLTMHILHAALSLVKLSIWNWAKKNASGTLIGMISHHGLHVLNWWTSAQSIMVSNNSVSVQPDSLQKLFEYYKLAEKCWWMGEDSVSLIDLARMVEVCEKITTTFKDAELSRALHKLRRELHSVVVTYQTDSGLQDSEEEGGLARVCWETIQEKALEEVYIALVWVVAMANEDRHLD